MRAICSSVRPWPSYSAAVSGRQKPPFSVIAASKSAEPSVNDSPSTGTLASTKTR